MDDVEDSGPSTDGRQSRWAEHNYQRRLSILEAAVQVIEEHPAGTEVHVRQIAERAGLGRTVVYRHFEDRSDLDRQVHAHVLGLLRDELAPHVVLTGTIEGIIDRIVRAYVAWAAAHPALHRLAEQQPVGEGGGELGAAVALVAEQMSGLFTLGAELLGVTLPEGDDAVLDLLVFGLVAQAFGSVRQWLSGGAERPPAARVSTMIAQSTWFQIDGHARLRGFALDPTLPLDDLVADALAGLATRA